MRAWRSASGDDRPASEIQPAGASRRCARLARMSLSLPAEPSRARSLTRVVPELIAALDGRSEWFAPATSAVLFVVDGLGARNLAARAGHGRFLAAAGTKKDTARTVFPSTTAAALTSLLTGTDPGVHGIVGYRVRIPGTDSGPQPAQGLGDRRARPARMAARAAAPGARVARRSSVLRRVQAGVRRLRVHRGDPPRGRPSCPPTPSPSVPSSPPTSRRGIRALSCICTRLSWTRRRIDTAGSPTNGPPPWRRWMPRPARSRRRSVPASGRSSRPTTAWSTCRA